ncbi:unnamed protein product [Dicrocoelium dendriticum]|nr:unnamed protein product [Dicrocoelium dendriticum]
MDDCLPQPSHLLIPSRLKTSFSSTVGPCTSLVVLTDDPASAETTLASGHLNGWALLWSLNKRRNYYQWIAHPNGQVTSLHWWSQNSVIISQGRDGYIRFWLIPIGNLSLLQSTSSPVQTMTEIRTCDVTFCSMDLWSESSNSSSDLVHYLAHISDNDDSSDRTNSIEVIQLPQNLIIFNSCCVQPDEGITGLSKTGMCMALRGIVRPDSPTTGPRCVFIAAYEAGHILLFGDGHVISRIDNCLGTAVPVMCLGMQPIIPGQCKRLVVVGGPSTEHSVTNTSATNVTLLHLVFNESVTGCWQLNKTNSQLQTTTCGISSVAWRPDGRIVAIGQWNGHLQLAEFTGGSRLALRNLGWLTSLGGLGEGELLGDWAATSVTKPHGPQVDQKSTSIRCCVFTTHSHWLISAAPANAGALGSLLVWDVYRTNM